MLFNSENISNDRFKETVSGIGDSESGPKHSEKSCCLTVTQIPVGVFVEENMKVLSALIASSNSQLELDRN